MKIQIIYLKPEVPEASTHLLTDMQKAGAYAMGRNFLRDQAVVAGYYDGNIAAKQTLQFACPITGKIVPIFEYPDLGDRWLYIKNDVPIASPPTEFLNNVHKAADLLTNWGPAWALREHFRAALLRIAKIEARKIATQVSTDPAVHPVIVVSSYAILELAALRTQDAPLLHPEEAMRFTILASVNWAKKNGYCPVETALIRSEKL